MNPDATVIIAFYNKVHYLDLVLSGFARQTHKNFEVILADDGSNKGNVSKVKQLIKAYEFPIHHLWQEDDGFRKNILLNRSIMKSRSSIMIFVDGDCVPHSCFVEEHIKSTKPGACSTARRVNLSQKFTNRLTPHLVRAGILEHSLFSYLMDAVLKRGNHSGQGIYVKNPFLRKWINRKNRGILGSNFSVHKKDLVKINGFDERYRHPAVGEDTDIEFRLRLNEDRIQSLVNAAIQFHLYHKLLPRKKENDLIFEEVKRRNEAVTPYGIYKS